MRLGSTRCQHLYPDGGSRRSCLRKRPLAVDAYSLPYRPNKTLQICSTDSSRSFRLPPESANETDSYNHRQKRQAVVNIRSVVSELCKVEETKSSSGTTNKSEEIGKIEVHIISCQITSDKTTRAQVQTKI